MISLAVLEQAGVLSALDVELAKTLARVSKEEDALVHLAVALTSREVQAGHVCLDLARWAGRAAAEVAEAAEALNDLRWPSLETFRGALERSRLVSVRGLEDARPLVLDGHHRLYLSRYFDHERALAERLRGLSTTPVPQRPVDEALVERLFQSVPGERDLQREAAVSSLGRRLSVIVGGPGTGKTSTVVKLLALLVSQTLSAGDAPPRILLVAPTGKAAQRLGEAIEKARDGLPVDAPVKQAIPHRALTVHRALGTLPGSTTRFRHHAGHPLACDVLLLDEASMVDLALMRRLLDALPDHARVILLGDPDQLVSVEAGGVLGDLCVAAARPESPMAACLSRLTRSYRYGEHSGIGKLARAVHAQDAEAALDVLRSGAPDVAFCPAAPPRPAALTALLKESQAHYAPLKSADVDTRLRGLDAFRVLCAHRRGPDGVEALNLSLARACAGRAYKAHDIYPGRPLIITQNDYASQLFNGDVGVLHGTGRNVAAYFRVGPDQVRRVALARLPRHESVYAMTVHKSQGSEFDRVALVLPERASPILTRELLYTAITRAKQAVSIYASEATLRTAIAQRTERASGLADRLL